MNQRLPNRLPGKGRPWTRTLSILLAALVALAPAAATARRRSGSGAIAAAPPAQFGFLLTVNTTGDGARLKDGVCDTDAATFGEQCSLRAAIQAANSSEGFDSINFTIPASEPNCDPATGGCVINLTQALPTLNGSVNINGPGADKLTVRRNTGGEYRIFDVTGAFTVSLSGMTISNGGSSSGAGVRNAGPGTVNLTNVVLSGNSASGSGSITSDNSGESGAGGGVRNSGGGTVNITNSTLSGNSANGGPSKSFPGSGAGGGVSNIGGATLNITNSTLSGNSASGGSGGLGGGSAFGGGIYNGGGTVSVTNSTLSGNKVGTSSSGRGGGIYNDDAEGSIVNVKSAVIADNIATPSGPDVHGEFASQGYNLVGKTDESTGFTQPTDLTGTVAAPRDPRLDPAGPQDNGGPTPTIALRFDSPAVDKGTSAGLTGPLSTDQRGAGFTRVVNDPFTANASGGDGADIGAFEIRPAVKFSSAAYSVNEGTANATITVGRTGPTTGTATVKFSTANGTALAGQDYTTTSGTLTFAAGQASRAFTVAITNDARDEADETVQLKLSSPTGGVPLGTPNAATLKIIDNDPPPKLSINNATVTEGASGALNATFTVTLAPASGRTVTVKYATANVTAKAPGDYTAKAGTLSFLAGQTTRTAVVPVRGDLLDEIDETFVVNLSAPVNATLGDAQGLGTITDNDPTPSLTVGDVSITEVDSGTNNVTLTVKLSAASGRTVSVNYATANGTASSTTDYVSKTGTVTFTAGQTTRTVVVQVRGDTLKEANETFFLNLSAAVNATIADSQGKVTVINDD
jgi:CSLREA domain-containing protein